jgi:hypothetical protein
VRNSSSSSSSGNDSSDGDSSDNISDAGAVSGGDRQPAEGSHSATHSTAPLLPHPRARTERQKRAR